MVTLGRKLAERQILIEQARNRNIRKKQRADWMSDVGRLARDWLSRRRDMISEKQETS